MLVVFFAIVNMCELVNCRPHGQTTRMTVSTKKPAQNPVKPEEQQRQKQEWKIEHIQHKIIKGDIKAYPTVQHPLLPFSLERPDLWKRAAQAAALVSRYQKAMKILEKYFPLEAVRCSPIWWKLGLLRTSHHLTMKSSLVLSMVVIWLCSKNWTNSIYFLGWMINHWNLDGLIMFNGRSGRKFPSWYPFFGAFQPWDVWQDDDADIGEDVAGLRHHWLVNWIHLLMETVWVSAPLEWLLVADG